MQDAPTSEDLVQRVRWLYDAARKDDLALFKAVTAQDFYAYENGERFTGEELMALLKAAHQSGKEYEWNIVEPEVRRDRDLACVIYRNDGAITDASGRTQVSWLESVILERGRGEWRIAFLHSTRSPRKV